MGRDNSNPRMSLLFSTCLVRDADQIRIDLDAWNKLYWYTTGRHHMKACKYCARANGFVCGDHECDDCGMCQCKETREISNE